MRHTYVEFIEITKKEKKDEFLDRVSRFSLETIKKVIRVADEYNIDRNEMVEIFANTMERFSRVANVENFVVDDPEEPEERVTKPSKSLMYWE